MTDTDARYIREYLDENPRHLHAAFAVASAWPAVKHDVCRRFLERLRDRVADGVREQIPEHAGDLDIGCRYGGDKHFSNLRLYRYGWVQYEDVGGYNRSDRRTAVTLEWAKGLTGCHWGVRCPKSKDDMTEKEKKRRQDIQAALQRSGLSPNDGPYWPHVARPDYQDWTVIVPDLADELANGDGKITDHYVTGLLAVAKKAIPAINEVEMEKGSLT